MPRVKGHTLESEGAAYYRPANPSDVRDRGRYLRVTYDGVGGSGFGLCSCGARSPELDSGQARKAWHRDHKRKVQGR